MTVSLNFLSRIVGMLVLAYIGSRIGHALSGNPPTETEELATALLTLAGAGLGVLTTHRWTIEPLQRTIRHLRSISIVELTTIVFGALLGLIFAVLLSVPLGYLPPPLGQFSPIVAAGILAYLGALVFAHRRKEIGDWLQSRRPSLTLTPGILQEEAAPSRYLLDTSAIIDGRIAAVSQTGFLQGSLIVPRFVLNELQMLADSADEQRRTRGRRGLDILNAMQKEPSGQIEILDVVLQSSIGTDEKVDDQLVLLARQYRCPLITNDYNLGRVAELQGIQVLSLNQLADAVRPPIVTGQDIYITIRDVGREREQGISFMDDGTMIVVEDARRLVGQQISATVTRIYQTQTGRIVFAHLNEKGHESPVSRVKG